MDYVFESETCRSRAFRWFVYLSLSVLMCSEGYTMLYGSSVTEAIETDFSDIKYVVVQLTQALTDVNRKHDRLKNEMERVSEMLPVVAAAAQRAKDSIDQQQPSSNSEKAITVLNFDHQMSDFALETAGARILSTGDTVEHAHHDSMLGWALHATSSLLCWECVGARAMLRPGSLPGQCWAFKGSRGEATILLIGSVIITEISLEHISPRIAPTREISSAPRQFTLEGLENLDKNQNPHDFGTFEYKIPGEPIQRFPVKRASTRGYNMVRVRFLSNWGNPVFTCVYRVRVHGRLAPGQHPPHAAHAAHAAHAQHAAAAPHGDIDPSFLSIDHDT